MKNRLFVILAAILLAAGVLSTSLVAQTTFYVVRHSEKVVSKSRDPELSKAGKERAETLARTLRSAKVDACLSTNYTRTKSTLAPTAKHFGLKVATYQAGREKALTKTWLTTYQGKTVVVSGHSNTVPNILAGLGVEEKITLKDSHYDNLFLVKISKEGKVSFTHLHYGKANPE